MIRLEVVQGKAKERAFESEEERITIGRAPGATFRLQDYHLSGEHGLIFQEGDQYIYRDLRSTNGSMLLRGSKRLLLDGGDRWESTLRDGDRLLLGDAASPVILLCKVVQRAEPSEEAHRIIAKRSLLDLPQVAGEVDKGPELTTLYSAIKNLGRRLELTDTLEAVAAGVFEVVPRATHVSILLCEGKDEERFGRVKGIPCPARSPSRGPARTAAPPEPANSDRAGRASGCPPGSQLVRPWR